MHPVTISTSADSVAEADIPAPATSPVAVRKADDDVFVAVTLGEPTKCSPPLCVIDVGATAHAAAAVARLATASTITMRANRMSFSPWSCDERVVLHALYSRTYAATLRDGITSFLTRDEGWPGSVPADHNGESGRIPLLNKPSGSQSPPTARNLDPQPPLREGLVVAATSLSSRSPSASRAS
jgi:hypothetical protein